MMRWFVVIFGLVFVAAAGGCSKQCYLFEKDTEVFPSLGLSSRIETDPELALKPLTHESFAKPMTIEDTEREPRYVTLSEAIATSLSKGLVGVQSTRLPGTLNEDLVFVLPGGGVSLTNVDSIRVLALNPAIADTALQAMLSRFDAKIGSGMIWNHADSQIQGTNSFTNGDSASWTSTLLKPLPDGGIAAIGLRGQYTFLNRPPTGFLIKNPAYETGLDFTFEQPLWQSFGTQINQLLPRHPGIAPGSTLPQSAQYALNSQSGITGAEGNSGIQPTGILIARIRFDQSRADLERVVSFQLINVETAYWNLYGAYVNLYASELALRQVHAVWRRAAERKEVGQKATTDYLPTLGQYRLFTADRTVAMGKVLEAERVLRGLMGLPNADGMRLVPVDTPVMSPYIPDWNSARTEALYNRPELVSARMELKTQQLNLMTLRNFTKPDLRFISNYSITGLGSRLDGNGQVDDPSTGSTVSTNALRNMASNHFNNATAGVVMTMPIGHRFENAAIRRAQLQLAQGFQSLQNEEEKAVRFLEKTYRDLFQKHTEFRERRAQRLAYAELVDKRNTEFLYGSSKESERVIEFLLEAERQFSSSLSAEYQALVEYNNALAAFQFAKGTILQHNNVVINEGGLPECAQVKAIDHERERTKAIVLRERAGLVMQPDCSAENGMGGLPLLPEQTAPSLYSLQQGTPELPKELKQKPLVRRDPTIVAPPPPPPTAAERKVDMENLLKTPVPPAAPATEAPPLAATPEPAPRTLNFSRPPLPPGGPASWQPSASPPGLTTPSFPAVNEPR